MNETIFLILRDLIHERTGIFYPQNKQQLLADKLAPCLEARNLRSFLDFYYLLKYTDTHHPDWRDTIEALVVPETFFWRESAQIELVVQTLLPEYLHQAIRGEPGYQIPTLGQPLTLWSAACSTGEEAYSLAIALDAAGWFQKVPLRIVASDLCPRSIAWARQGFYRERTFRHLPPALWRTYFQPRDQGWQVVPHLQRYIQWQVVNLLDEQAIAPLCRSPFIFCRNVFIYFSDLAIRKTVAHFYEYSPTPAYLFISSSESLLKLETGFQLRERNQTFFYYKAIPKSIST